MKKFASLAFALNCLVAPAAQVRFAVQLPGPSATVTVDGVDRGGNGEARRLFVSPDTLAEGTYFYEVGVTYRQISLRKRVYVETGKEALVTFSNREFRGATVAAILAQVEGWRSRFSPVGEVEVRNARTALLAALAPLDAWVGRQANPTAWRGYLRREALGVQLAANVPDTNVVSEVLSRYFGSQRGLELAEFRSVRRALERFRDTLVFSRQSNLRESYLRALDTIATHLSAYERAPSSETSYLLGKTLGWLQRAGQASDLVRAIHDRFSKPNFLLSLSHRLLAPQFVKDINETEPVEEIIRGANVTGVSDFRGSTSLRFVPDEDRALLEVVLLGTIASETEGYRQRVTVQTTGRTTVDARKRFVITQEGIRPLPATASCVTTSTINSARMNAFLPLVRRIGVNRAYQEQPAAEWESARLSERNLRAKLDRVPTTPFDSMSGLFYENLYYPQQRLGVDPESLFWSTTTDQLHHRSLRKSADQLAAPNSAPHFSSDLDLVMSVHETEAANLLNPQFAGKVLTDEMLADFLKLVFGRTPREFRLGTHLDPWSSTLDRDRPFQADFGNNRARLTLRLQTIDINGVTHRIPVKISGQYEIFASVFGPAGRRIGEIEIMPSSATAITPEIERFLRRKFNDVFQVELHADGLTPPQGGAFDLINQLEMKEFRSEDGWVLFGWQLPPTARRASP